MHLVQMWLLDHNLPKQLKAALKRCGVESSTTFERGWHQLQNGQLVAQANAAGFTCILTRDVRFGESASRALAAFPAMSVVVLRIPQSRGQHFAQVFEAEWIRSPIMLMPGKLIDWPSIHR